MGGETGGRTSTTGDGLQDRDVVSVGDGVVQIVEPAGVRLDVEAEHMPAESAGLVEQVDGCSIGPETTGHGGRPMGPWWERIFDRCNLRVHAHRGLSVETERHSCEGGAVRTQRISMRLVLLARRIAS